MTRIVILLFLFLVPFTLAAQDFNQLMDKVWDSYGTSPLECIDMLEDAMALAKDADNIQWQLEALETKGIIFDELGFGNKAIEIYLEVLRERERLGDKEALISLNLNLGIVHSGINNNELALEHYKNALALAQEFNDVEGELVAYNNLGTQYSKIGDYKNSLECFQSILAKPDLSSEHYCSAYSNLGLAYRRWGKNAEALVQFKEAIPFVPTEKGRVLLTYTINLGISQALDRQYEQAEVNLIAAHDMAAEIGHRQAQSNACQELSILFEKQSDDSKALKWLNKHLEIENKLEEIKNSKYISTLSVAYDVEQIENEVAALEFEKKDRTIRLWTISTIAVILLLALLFVWFVLRSRLKERRQREKIQGLQLEKQEADISKYRRELEIKTEHLLDKNRLVQEINEELSKLKSTDDDPVVKELLKTRILTNKDWEVYKRSFSLVHVGFFDALNKRAPDLTQGEQRTSALCRLQLSNTEIAEILGISERSVIQNKYRLRKKLDLGDNDELEKLLESLS